MGRRLITVPAIARTQMRNIRAHYPWCANAGEKRFPPAHEGELPMHNTEFEKYPTSGEENVEVDVFWPIQDA